MEKSQKIACPTPPTHDHRPVPSLLILSAASIKALPTGAWVTNRLSSGALINPALAASLWETFMGRHKAGLWGVTAPSNPAK